MGTSKYPNELDSSIEMPPVRDNILEVGSDVINSLRSAIFSIERTLGINPQGTSGNTVASRLNRALDGNGNIKKDALALANILSGPIIDSDVAVTAAIQESKLSLTFPTQVLQDEISMLSGELDLIEAQIGELSSTLAAHININAINRHPASAISVETKTSTPSDTATKNIETSSVQTELEAIYDSHINYSGEDISSTNNSHTAEQIFFDSTNVDELPDVDNVQDAIEAAATLTTGGVTEHQDRMHSNGYLKWQLLENNIVIEEDADITFSISSGSSTGISSVVFPVAIDTGDLTLEPSDWLIIEDDADVNENFIGTYEIESISFDISGDVDGVSVYGYFGAASLATTTGTLVKNPNMTYNKAGLLSSVREDATLTSSRIVQVADPNAVKVQSLGVKPSEITSGNRFIELEIDGTSSVIDLYEVTASKQTIDSMIKRINEQVAENNLNVLAYRIDNNNTGSEFAIVHNLVGTTQIERTLKVSASTDDGITAAGLSYIDGITRYQEDGGIYSINGNILSGLKQILNTTGVTFFSGSNIVNQGSANVDFIALGIRSGQLLTIINSASDDGTYVIDGVTSTNLTITADQLPAGFAGNSDSDTAFIINDNSISVEGLIFEKISGTFGTSVIDVFMDSAQGLFWKKRIEYPATLSGIDSVFDIVDFSGPDIVDDFVGIVSLSISDNASGNIPYISIDGGMPVDIYGDHSYFWINSGASNASIKVYIQSESALRSYILANGDIVTTIYGYSSENLDTNMSIGRLTYASYKGRFVGGIDADIPRALDKVKRGSISSDDLDNSVYNELSWKPMDELRGNGVIFGGEVTASIVASGNYSLVINPGICYVNGKRFIIDLQTIETDINSVAIDKFYIAVNSDGNIDFQAALSGTCSNPFDQEEVCLLSTIEYDGAVVYSIDIRLFIDEVDLKILNSITVSPNSKFAHFDDVSKAIKYARRFSQIYSNAGTPTIQLKSGIHEVTVDLGSENVDLATWVINFFADPATNLTNLYNNVYDQGIFIDFPLNLVGEGDTTVLKPRMSISLTDGIATFRGFIIIPGDEFAFSSRPFNRFNDGFINLKDMKVDNGRVSLIDLVTDDGAGTNFVFGVNVENVAFDFQNFTPNSLDVIINPKAISIAEESNTTRNKGNIRIAYCKFIDSAIYIDQKSRVVNLQICDNIKMGSALIPDFLCNQNILEFSSISEGANIEIYGNYNSENFDTLDSGTGPNFDDSGTRMGSRIERDLHVGGKVHVRGEINATNYLYNATRERVEFWTIDQITQPTWDNIPAVGTENAGTTLFDWRGAIFGPLFRGELKRSSPSGGGGPGLSGISWPTVELDDGEDFVFPIFLKPGETLKEIEFGVSATPLSTYLLEVDIINKYTDANSSVYSSSSSTSAGFPISYVVLGVVFSGINVSLSGNNLNICRFVNITGAGLKSVYWVQITYETTNIESSLGIS